MTNGEDWLRVWERMPLASMDGQAPQTFDKNVSGAVGRPRESIEWLDFKFDAKKVWPDAELKGLEFLYDQPGLESLKSRWESFWPTGRGVHNWDAVG